MTRPTASRPLRCSSIEFPVVHTSSTISKRSFQLLESISQASASRNPPRGTPSTVPHSPIISYAIRARHSRSDHDRASQSIFQLVLTPEWRVLSPQINRLILPHLDRGGSAPWGRPISLEYDHSTMNSYSFVVMSPTKYQLIFDRSTMPTLMIGRERAGWMTPSSARFLVYVSVGNG